MFSSIVVYHSIEYTLVWYTVDVLSIHSIHTLVSTLTNHTDKRLQYLTIYCSPFRTQCSIISKKCSFNFNTRNLQSSSYNPDFSFDIKICSR